MPEKISKIQVRQLEEMLPCIDSNFTLHVVDLYPEATKFYQLLLKLKHSRCFNTLKYFQRKIVQELLIFDEESEQFQSFSELYFSHYLHALKIIFIYSNSPYDLNMVKLYLRDMIEDSTELQDNIMTLIKSRNILFELTKGNYLSNTVLS
jgi:hypothetical protein